MGRIFTISACFILGTFYTGEARPLDLDMVQMTKNICDEEIRALERYGTDLMGDRQRGKRRFMNSNWQFYQYQNSMILRLVINHNIFWFDQGSWGGGEDKSFTVLAALYVEYDDQFGWIWYQDSRQAQVSLTPGGIKEMISFMRTVGPVGVIAATPDSRRQIALRFMCRKFLKTKIFSLEGGGGP